LAYGRLRFTVYPDIYRQEHLSLGVYGGVYGLVGPMARLQFTLKFIVRDIYCQWFIVALGFIPGIMGVYSLSWHLSSGTFIVMGLRGRLWFIVALGINPGITRLKRVYRRTVFRFVNFDLFFEYVIM